MPGIRTRKAIGILACFTFLVIYSLLAMVVGATLTSGAGKLAQLAYYVVAGFAWLPVVMAIIRWMSRA